MSEEKEFESLFAEFDDVAEAGVAPPIPERLIHNRPRRVGIWTRFLRWVVRGPGLLLILYFVFLSLIIKEPEAGLNVPGALLSLWLVVPLLGKRPLANPWRMALLMIPSMAFLIANATLVRAGIEIVESGRRPIHFLVRTALSFLEKATLPSTIAVMVVLGLSSLLLSRRLALSLPWVETQFVAPWWRRGASYLVAGLTIGAVVSLPVAHHLAWNQPWLKTTELSTSPHSPIKESPGDLGETLPELYASPQPQKFSLEQNLEFLRVANARLRSPVPLTARDMVVIQRLAKMNAKNPADPVRGEFGWELLRRSSLNEVSPYQTHPLVIRQLLPMIAASPQLDLWQKQVAALPRQPVTTEQTDAAVATAIREEIAWRKRASSHPTRLVLFGRPTSIESFNFAGHIEDTVKILLYLNLRREITTTPSLLSLQEQQTSRVVKVLYSDLWRDLLSRLSEQKGPSHYLYLSQVDLLERVLELKSIKQQTGLYPAKMRELPMEISYHVSPDRKSATLEFKDSSGPAVIVTLP